eukprot:438193-Heterocapsa_arctica.AAC.1
MFSGPRGPTSLAAKEQVCKVVRASGTKRRGEEERASERLVKVGRWGNTLVLSSLAQEPVEPSLVSAPNLGRETIKEKRGRENV